MGLEETEGAGYRIESEQLLDLPMAGCSGNASRQRQSLGAVCPHQRTTLLPILPRNFGRLERDEFKLGTNTRCLSGILQHVRAVWKHHLIEHLPQRRPAIVPTWQQDFTRRLQLQHRAVLLGQGLLHMAQQG